MSGFYSLGVGTTVSGIPYSPWPSIYIDTIENAIFAAWEALKSSDPDLGGKNETQITTALQRSLIDLLNRDSIEGFVCEIFGIPTRDASVTDYLGNIEKKPDLTFYCHTAKPLCILRAHFYECKPIGSSEVYIGNDGLERFLDGRYAWAMPHAGMIAYVKRKRQVDALSELTSKLGSPQSLVGIPTASISKKGCSVITTEHKRHFTVDGQLPGNIRIRHLWLSILNNN